MNRKSPGSNPAALRFALAVTRPSAEFVHKGVGKQTEIFTVRFSLGIQSEEQLHEIDHCFR
jgi:hypothetical protein